jgi:hypothetical protein
MPKYRTLEIYYDPNVDLADGNIGRYINQLRDRGLQAVIIKFVSRKEADTSHDEGPGEYEPYTDIQGNVGTS